MSVADPLKSYYTPRVLDRSPLVKNYVTKMILYQLIAIMGLALIIFLLKGIQSSLSALLGALAYFLPTSVFVLRVSAHSLARAATRFFVTFFVGEAVKLVFSGVLFVLIIQYCHAELLYALIGLVGAIVAYWISSIACLFHPGAKL